MDRRLEKPSSPFPLSSRALFRPIQVIGAEQLEATAASIAQAVGLRLPSVKFYAIAHRYLKELSLPVSGFPTRACVMLILIVAMRLLYNIQGHGMWEMSHSKVRNSPPNAQKLEKKLLHVQASVHSCQELFSILEATYDKINTTRDN
ncbi:uncharacterized protein A4U43_C10F9900 [Asparagus officinalis]|uniref:Uncharacterized protein n=1 Tax=Asparagus officinalis TaxID=4686 RepID=A0A5P1E1T2_ASPOF|nr:uncharacterized protein A4U43_C10F9900 [Asparagus officinalis]